MNHRYKPLRKIFQPITQQKQVSFFKKIYASRALVQTKRDGALGSFKFQQKIIWHVNSENTCQKEAINIIFTNSYVQNKKVFQTNYNLMQY